MSRRLACLVCSLAAPALVGALPGGASLPQRPPAAIDFALAPQTIAANCKSQIERARRDVDAIAAVAGPERSFATIVRPLEDVSANLNDRLLAETFLSNVASDRAVRDASLACQNDASDFLTGMAARPELYAAVAAAAKRGDASSRADRKLLELWLLSLQRSGAGLPLEKRTEFVALSQKLSQTQNAFSANLGNEKTTIELSATQLAGLPPDLVANFKRDGDAWIVSVNESTAAPFMQNAADPAARKAYYYARYTSLPQNLALLREALTLRDRLAHLLGYPTWAAFVLADRMAGSPARVTSFLDKLDARLLPRAKQDVARLATLKAKDLGIPAATIEPWDVAFYDEKLRATQFSVDGNEVRRYFPVEHVERAVFDIYSKILGVTFAQRTRTNAWNPDVTQWSVSDAASGRYIGDFYLDLFPREGKFSHFASFPLLPNRESPAGSVRPPLDAIVGNWPKAAPGKPALLSHDDVETFFHEFGHAMATMLATAPYESESGGFRLDFIEAPSQMLENWVWDPQILKQLSSNVTTGAPLPDALITKMRAARYVDEALDTTRQIMLATVDMSYHTAGESVDTTAIWSRVALATTPIALPPGVHPESGFGHLMGGYDVGYYGYLWSKVYAQDMFTAFEQGGLESPVVGARYRRDVLEPARELEPDEEIRAFLGRPMNPSAFYKQFDVEGNPPTN